MTKNKPIISILMACLLLFGVFGWTVTARAEIASGTCGTCNWVIDDEGTLTISPADGTSGKLDSCYSYSNWPWYRKRSQVKKVVIEEGVAANSKAVGMFYEMSNCKVFETNNLNTSGTSDLSNMFYGCRSLADTSGFVSWDTSNVTNMTYMFNTCTSLTDTSGLTSWNTDKVTNMNGMFNGCTSLADTSGFTNWSTGNVYDMSSMFYNCSSLTNVSGLANWNTSKVYSMPSMFRGCKSLVDVSGLTGWNTGLVTNMAYMFSGCISLENTSGLAGLDTGNVTNMNNMFSNCTSLADTSGFTNWDTGKVTNMSYMFQRCSPLAETSGFANWNTGNVTNMGCMFFDCSSLVETSGFADWDTGNVTNMGSMFGSCSSLSEVSGFADWDTGSVTSMSSMFNSCTSLADSSGFAKWHTGNVTDMSNMFASCPALLDTAGFEDWDTGNVTNMYNMFCGCSSLADTAGFADWRTGNVTDMGSMFSGCTSLKDASGVGGWDTGNVTNMKYMFFGCTILEKLDMSDWDTSAVTGFNSMFTGIAKLKRVNIGENVKFDGDGILSSDGKLTLPTPPSSQDGISYTRKWIREDGSAGPFTPAEMITNYSPEMAGWWVWEEVPVSYRLSYAAPDQAAGSMAPETVKATEGHTLPRCGYVLFANRFDHWVDGRGNSYPDMGTIPANRYSAGDQVTLTAVFVPIDTKVNVVDGAFEVSLHAGEKAKFDGIPAGTAYQVFEETPDGWLLVGQVNSSGQIEPLKEAKASFINRYQPDITSVQFSGSKTLDSRPAEEGSYTFQLLENGVVIQEKTILPGGFIQFDPITYERGDAGVHVYTIREKDSGNDAVEHDTHEETITVTVTDNGDGTLSSTASYDEDGIVFANKLRPGTLKLGKTANGATDANSGDTFKFRITFQNENGQPLDDDIYWYVEEDGVPVDNTQGP